MLKWQAIESTLEALQYTTVKTNKGVKYINLSCGFDIETTSEYVQGHKAAYAYIWMLGIGYGENVFYGRSWDDLAVCLEQVQKALDLHENNRLVIYVHNLGYEFQFMRKYFNWLNVFAVDERKPVKALCDYGIEFRDSYILSGYSLANTAKNLTKYKVQKLTGDLDYSLKRHEETPLTEKELGYCENDIKVITAYIQEQLDLYGDIDKIPLTNTGRVRTFVKNECYYTSKNHRKTNKGKYNRYRKIMNDLTLTPEIYVQLKRAFMGGFTHANGRHSGKTLENVSSIDFTSSYPSVMVSEMFPMSRFKPIVLESIQQLDDICSVHAVVFDVKFNNISTKIEQETYISESKCFNLSKPVLNNGRVYSAESLSTTITDVDYEIIKQVYSWDSIEVSNVNFAYKNYLPKDIVNSILKLYEDKTTLKDVEGYETEYLLSKGMLNSVYGMSVTDIVKDNAIYLNEWDVEKVDINEEIDNYNNSKNRFLYYAWGLWVTAYARRNLWTGILAVGNDYVYSDTDSLKMLNYNKHGDYIEWFNNQIISKMNAVCSHHKLDAKKLAPKTKQGKVKMMGVWDYEGTYTRFKTLGAKRYLVEENGKLHITVAGLSKQKGLEYLLRCCDYDNGKVFEMFNDSLYVPGAETGKMTHTYIDDELKFKTVDYLGNESTVNPLTGIHLENCDFTLSIAEQYKDFMKKLSEGLLFKGVKSV